MGNGTGVEACAERKLGVDFRGARRAEIRFAAPVGRKLARAGLGAGFVFGARDGTPGPE